MKNLALLLLLPLAACDYPTTKAAAQKQLTNVVMPDSSFWPEPKGADYVVYQGRLVGDRLAYPNNVWTIKCFHQKNLCEAAHIEQIGDKQMGDLEIDEFEITDWNDDFVAAQDEEICETVTLNFNRANQTVGYVAEPRNLSKPYCDHADTQVRRYTFDKSIFWKRVDQIVSKHG